MPSVFDDDDVVAGYSARQTVDDTIDRVRVDTSHMLNRDAPRDKDDGWGSSRKW